MARRVHANVGLMHALMAHLQCVVRPRAGVAVRRDRSGRRGAAPPWIDWIHTVEGPGRSDPHYVKWDDEPAWPPRWSKQPRASRSRDAA